MWRVVSVCKLIAGSLYVLTDFALASFSIGVSIRFTEEKHFFLHSIGAFRPRKVG